MIEKIRNKLYNYPHRCNDADVEYLIATIDDLQDDYKQLQDEYHKLLTDSREHSNAMLGNVLGLMLNNDKFLYRENK